MSKPMTEARLAEIEVFVNRNAEADMIAMSRVGMVDIIAEVRRLRACIAKAPHNDTCSFDKNANPFHDATTCDCGVGDWQREALGE